ncbi:MAG: hypothetical protein WCP21_02030 [Armatimonadota bacterium]
MTVYADVSGGTATVRSMRFWREMFAPNGQLREEVLTKLCFGTDLSYYDADYDCRRCGRRSTAGIS